MKFKKTIIIILSFVLMFTFVSGCAKTEETKSSARKKTIEFFMFGNNRDIDLVNQIARTFESKNPLIKVNVTSSTGDYYDNVLQRLGTNAPDIFFVEPGDIGYLLKDEEILNLQTYLDNGTVLKASDLWDINDAFKYDGTNVGKGDIYALIKDWSSTFTVVVNRKNVNTYNATLPKGASDPKAIDLSKWEIKFDENTGTVTMPKSSPTWDEYFDMAVKLTGNGKKGSVMDYVPVLHLLEWVQMSGGNLFSDDYTKLNTNDPDVKSAFNFFYELQKGRQGSIAPAAYATGGSSQSLGGEQFANGLISTAFYGRWAFTSYDWLGAEKNIDVAVLPNPIPATIKDNTPFMATTSPVAISIYSKSKNKDESYKFVEYYMTEGMKELCKKGFNIPGNKTIAEKEFIDKAFINNANEWKYNKIFYEFGKNYTKPIALNPKVRLSTLTATFSSELDKWLQGQFTSYDATIASIKTKIETVISRG